MTDLSADRAQALELTPVSRETIARLDRYVELLLERQSHTNLIAPSTIPIVWTRHIADSLQLLALAPEARIWVDLGSGAGFPGLAIACALAEEPRTAVHLVESNNKKADFLRDVARDLALPVVVHPVRIEDYGKNLALKPDVVTARALAPLEVLLGYARPILGKHALGLFMKGQDVEAELTKATKYWTMNATLVPSKTNPQSRIVVVRDLERRQSRR